MMEQMNIAYSLPDDHPRLGSFWNIVEPIVKSDYIRDNSKLKQEEEYLKDLNIHFLFNISATLLIEGWEQAFKQLQHQLQFKWVQLIKFMGVDCYMIEK